MIVLGQVGDEYRRFRLPVILQETRPPKFQGAVDGRARHRRRAIDDRAHRTEIGFGDAGVIHQHAEHGRHHVERGRLPPLHRLDIGGGRKAREYRRGRPANPVRQHEASAGMDHRSGVQHDVALAHVVIGENVQRHRRPTCLGVLDGFQFAGGAGREDGDDDVVGLRPPIRWCLGLRLRQRQKIVRACGIADADDPQAGHGLRQLACAVGEIDAVQQDADAGTLQHLLLLRHRQPRIERHARQPGLGDAEVHRNGEYRIVLQQPDAGADRKPQRIDENIGDLIGELLDLREGQRLVAIRHRRPRSVIDRAAAHQLRHQHRNPPAMFFSSGPGVPGALSSLRAKQSSPYLEPLDCSVANARRNDGPRSFAATGPARTACASRRTP